MLRFKQPSPQALVALREAVELYFEDVPAGDFILVSDAEIGQEAIHA